MYRRPFWTCPILNSRTSSYLLANIFASFLPKEKIWMYSICTVFPRNLLKKATEVMRREAGISERKTNHSLHATTLSVLVFLKNDSWRHRAPVKYTSAVRVPITDTERSSVLHTCPRKEVVHWGSSKFDNAGPCSVGQVQTHAANVNGWPHPPAVEWFPAKVPVVRG